MAIGGAVPRATAFDCPDSRRFGSPRAGTSRLCLQRALLSLPGVQLHWARQASRDTADEAGKPVDASHQAFAHFALYLAVDQTADDYAEAITPRLYCSDTPNRRRAPGRLRMGVSHRLSMWPGTVDKRLQNRIRQIVGPGCLCARSVVTASCSCPPR